MKKSTQWQKEIEELRSIIQSTKLTEATKWNLHCFCFGEQNVAIIQPFKKCLALMFFKGTLLKDSKGLLVDNGPNSQAARRLEFGSLEEIVKKASTIKTYIKEAIDIETSGQKISVKKKPESHPEELKQAFVKNVKLKRAFESLTPGRQRAYILFFSGAKQSSTRHARIEKCIPQILQGKGLNN